MYFTQMCGLVTRRRHCRVRCAEQGLHEHLPAVPLPSCWNWKMRERLRCPTQLWIRSSRATLTKYSFSGLIQLPIHGLDESWPDPLCCQNVPWDLRAGHRRPEFLHDTVKQPALKSGDDIAKLLPTSKNCVPDFCCIFSPEENTSSHRFRAM